MPFFRRPNLLLSVLLTLWTSGVGFGASDPPLSSPDPREPPAPLVRLFAEEAKGLLTATRNREFLSTPLSTELFDGLKAHLGRDVTERVVRWRNVEGKTIRDLLQSSSAIVTDYPQAISYLISVRRRQGVKVFGNDLSPQTLEIENPARSIPDADLLRIGSGAPGAGDEDRFRDYLKANFGLDDNQVQAYAVYLRLTQSPTGPPPRDLSGLGSKAFSEALSQNTEVGGKGGLYVPSREILSRFVQILSFQQQFSRTPGADPSSFKGSDGRTLGDLLSEFEPDVSKRSTMDELKSLSVDEVRSRVFGLLRNIAIGDLNGPNHFLIDLKIARVLKPPKGDAQPVVNSSRRLRGAKLDEVIGNGQVRAQNDALYKSLILDELKPSQRDQIELDSDGEFFSIRGRPADIRQKHYDPPVDPESTIFGAGMNLENRPPNQD